MTSLAFLLTFFYIAGLVWLGTLIRNLFKASKSTKPHYTATIPSSISGVSIIVPFRNESSNLQSLLKSLNTQVFPEDQFECILVDDHSEDAYDFLKAQFANKIFRWMKLDNGSVGKKSALEWGIQHARFEIILTTDADCEHHDHWIASMTAPFQSPSTQLVIGPVSMIATNLFDRLQQLEFSAVVASGLLFAAIGKPMYCNGANLAFRRSAFYKVNGYSGNLHLASGDDVFLLEKIYRTFKNGIEVNVMKEALVKTKPSSDIKTFLNQRIRWAAKSRHALSQSNFWLGVFIFLYQLISVYGWLQIFSGKEFAGMILLLPRWLGEGWLLYRLSFLFRFQSNWIDRLILSFVYPFYVLLTALASWFYSPRWKGRPTIHSKYLLKGKLK